MQMWSLFRLKGAECLQGLFEILLCDAVELLKLIF